jgi:hypothetical protein
MEAFSGVLVGLRRYLVAKDFVGYQRALPQVLDEWSRRRGDAERDWGGQNRVGVVAMDSDGALLALRPVGVGSASLEYATLR